MISYAVFCLKKIFLMIRRPPRSTHCISSAASDVYKRQDYYIWTDSERVKRLGLRAFDTPDVNAAGLWHKVGPESEHFEWEEFEKRSKTPIDLDQGKLQSNLASFILIKMYRTIQSF